MGGDKIRDKGNEKPTLLDRSDGQTQRRLNRLAELMGWAIYHYLELSSFLIWGPQFHKAWASKGKYSIYRVG